MYPGIAALLRQLFAAPDVRVALITRNMTIDPQETLKYLFRRHEIDMTEFDFLACIPLQEHKTEYMRRARQSFAINPARTYSCGDEYSDYLAAINAGICPFVVAYGFEDQLRLTGKFGVPVEVISASPAEFSENLLNALNL